MINFSVHNTMDICIILMYSVVLAYYFKIRHKIPKITRKVAPYFVIGIFLILSLTILHLLPMIFHEMHNSVGFIGGIEILQTFAGFLFFIALLKLYQLEVKG